MNRVKTWVLISIAAGIIGAPDVLCSSVALPTQEEQTRTFKRLDFFVNEFQKALTGGRDRTGFIARIFSRANMTLDTFKRDVAACLTPEATSSTIDSFVKKYYNLFFGQGDGSAVDVSMLERSACELRKLVLMPSRVSLAEFKKRCVNNEFTELLKIFANDYDLTTKAGNLAQAFNDAVGKDLDLVEQRLS